MRQHESGLVGYTASRKPVTLLWAGEFETREQAIAFERKIKGWSRAKKEALIAGDWNRITELANAKRTWGPEMPFDRLRANGEKV
ncbi:tRNA/rRNA methyltransferase/putative endonuclease [Aromatoleum tolulyticum]|uniref:tRNA/rRNA methyltransferase/putative endonuclease n=2 Tax=Aromatoleum tolulyticum TaxID=34027 RepID=A0A1N7B2F8_9RHOO|nr:tRNA/rRNA methyltransferase/putative endonuclease [Aromatoleum tolulyticum]